MDRGPGLDDVEQLIGSTTRMQPNFLVVGGQRCGSTWLDSALRGHPDIFLPSRKQSYFFDINYHQGIDWYLERFAEAQPRHKAIGEVATGYCLPHAVPRVARHLPDAKLVMSVRNPVERAYSYYQSRAIVRGWSSFAEALAAEPEILDRGRYIEQIEALLGAYPRDRLLVVNFERLSRDGDAYLEQIFDFIGVDTSYRSPQVGKVVQTAAFPGLRRTLRRFGAGGVIEVVGKSPLGDPIRRFLTRPSARRYPPMPAPLRAELCAYFAPYNERLARFTGWDLEHWDR
jgi:hypothetical protein